MSICLTVKIPCRTRPCHLLGWPPCKQQHAHCWNAVWDFASSMPGTAMNSLFNVGFVCWNAAWGDMNSAVHQVPNFQHEAGQGLKICNELRCPVACVSLQCSFKFCSESVCMLSWLAGRARMDSEEQTLKCSASQGGPHVCSCRQY